MCFAGICRNPKLIRDSVITLDGYTGFTPVQYRLLDLFLRYSRRVVGDRDRRIQPCRSGEKRGVQDLFYMSCEMIDKLNALARQNHVKREPDIVLDEHPAVRCPQGSKEAGGTGGAGGAEGAGGSGRRYGFFPSFLKKFTATAAACIPAKRRRSAWCRL